MKILHNPVLSKKYIDKISTNKLLSASLFSQMQLASYQKGEYLYRQEDDLTNLFILVDGEIKVSYAASNGKETILRILKQPRIVGELELILDKPAVSTVEVLAAAHCFLLPLTQCRQALLSDALFLVHVCANLADALSVSNNIVSLTQNFSPKERCVSYILSAEKDHTFSFDYKTVANIIGISERHIFRIMSGLIQDGLISKHGKGFLIVDMDMLSELAGDSYMTVNK